MAVQGVMSRATLIPSSHPLLCLDRKLSATWLEEQRVRRTMQTEYLQRLAQLRDSLLEQETANLNKAVSRTLRSFPKAYVTQSQPKRKTASQASELAPQRHLRLQMAKAEELERRRLHGMTSHPPLNVSVTQLAQPVVGSQRAESLPQDPFDISVLQPADPFDRLFYMERERLANALAVKTKQKESDKRDSNLSPSGESSTSSKTRAGATRPRQGELLTPRRGNEWFISGRYKTEPPKPFKVKMPKPQKAQTALKKKTSEKPASGETEAESRRLEIGGSATGSRHGVSTAGSRDGGTPSYKGPTPTPVPWEKWRPDSVHSKPGSALIGPSSAGRSRLNPTREIDPHEFHTTSGGGSPGGAAKPGYSGKYSDLPRSKVIALVQQAHNGGSNLDFDPAVFRQRHNSDHSPKFRKGLQGSLKTSKRLTDASLPVPVGSGLLPSDNKEPGRGYLDPESDETLQVVSKSSLSGAPAEPLHVPARTSQPRINLRHSSPDLRSQDQHTDANTDVSLKRIFRQNELRQREVNNLFEDIKELNYLSQSLDIVEKHNS